MPYHKEFAAHIRNDLTQTQADRYLTEFLKAFPSEQAIAQELFEHDGKFRELCGEYEACNEAVEGLGNSRFDEALRSDYQALQSQIEAELLRYIVDRELAGDRR